MRKWCFPLRGSLFVSLIIGSCLVTSQVLADTSVATVTVKVTVVSEPCVINNGDPIVVNFGDNLLTTEVNGSNYIQPIDYKLSCPDATSDDLKMTISGSGAGFDSRVLQGSQPSLGIKILSDGELMPLNHALNFNRNTHPVLQAVPVKDPAGKLSVGNFTASATMSVEYQ